MTDFERLSKADSAYSILSIDTTTFEFSLPRHDFENKFQRSDEKKIISWYFMSFSNQESMKEWRLMSSGDEISASLSSVRPCDKDEINKITATFDLNRLKALTEKHIPNVLADLTVTLREPPCIVGLDVGQGMCTTIHSCAGGDQLIHFDAGGGFGWNKKTYPKHITFTPHTKAIVILSHRDKDHWVSAEKFPSKFHHLTWIVPYQPAIGASHFKLAASISRKGKGNLLVWKSSTVQKISFKCLYLLKLPEGSDKNESGIVTAIYVGNNEMAVLPGDASYSSFSPHLPKFETTALVVPHHGGKSVGAPPPAPIFHKVVYAYGKDNTYHHPSDTVIDDHIKCGWLNRKDTANGTILIHPSICPIAHTSGSGCSCKIKQV